MPAEPESNPQNEIILGELDEHSTFSILENMGSDSRQTNQTNFSIFHFGINCRRREIYQAEYCIRRIFTEGELEKK